MSEIAASHLMDGCVGRGSSLVFECLGLPPFGSFNRAGDSCPCQVSPKGFVLEPSIQRMLNLSSLM